MSLPLLEIRPITPDEFPALMRMLDAAFGEHISEEALALDRALFEFDRSLVAFDSERMAGSAGANSVDLTLPGLTTLPVAGVSWVGVLPTHRRRGILRALMRRQLDDVRARGEAIAILMASESSIYGRFGYGLASSTLGLEIDRRHTHFARPFEWRGQVSLVDHEQAVTVLPALYDRARRLRPGAISRNAAWWAHELRDPAGSADGAGPRFYVVYEPEPGRSDGAAVYRIKQQWEGGLAASTLVLSELIALTPEAGAALWRYCFDVDLVQTVQAGNRPVDEPLRWLLADPRRLRVTRLTDDLWLRLVDIPAALAARRYATPGRIVFEVVDPFCPASSGRYELEGGPDGATCHPTAATADLALDVADLGAAYLGGVRFGTLARAGRVSAPAPRALERADALFTCEPAPWCATDF